MKSRLFLWVILLIIALPRALFAQVTPAMLEAQLEVPKAQIIVESNSYIPSFYKGRAEPTVGTTAFFTAMTKESDLETLYYHWRINGLVTTPEPAQGLQQIEWAVPITGLLRVNVVVSTASGSVVAEGGEVIALAEPELEIYEVTPLYGTKSTALNDTSVLVGDEVVFKAAPYFFNQELLSIPNATEWMVDGVSTESNLGDPLQIALERVSEEAGTTLVSFSIRDRLQLVHQAEANFVLVY